ncbi:MAG TPA: LEA type 2 family protein [Puia sp.]|nr:LEA type 2 family protein [Puia sp.]
MNPFTLLANSIFMLLRKQVSFFILLATLMHLLFACEQPQPPEYKGFDNLQLGKLNLQESTLSARIKFYNPNAFGMELKKVDMNIFLNEKLANHYVLDTLIQIPKKDSFFVPVTLKLNVGNLLSNALQALLSNEVHIRIDGIAKLKKGALGFNVPLKYDETQRADQLLGQ